MCLLYKVILRVGCVECYTAIEGCVCVFWWKTLDLTCLNRLNAALDEWHSETGFKWRSIGMRRLTEIMTAAIFVLSIPSFASSASFDCAKASTDNEIAICSDVELSVLDETLAAVYKEARGSVSDSERLKVEQINWIKSLGTCDGNVDCLINAYKTRMVVLDYLDGQVSMQPNSNQDHILQLNEREEMLSMREQALTTELRALNSEIERFEDEKRQFYESKGVDQASAQPSSVTQKADKTEESETAVKAASNAQSVPNYTLEPYSSQFFDYTPCSDWPVFKDPKVIQDFQETLVNLIDM